MNFHRIRCKAQALEVPPGYKVVIEEPSSEGLPGLSTSGAHSMIVLTDDAPPRLVVMSRTRFYLKYQTTPEWWEFWK